MPIYECNKCFKKFNHKTDFNRHNDRKISCTDQIANKDNICPKCDYEFSSYIGLFNHVKRDSCGKKTKNKIPKKIKELTWNEYIGIEKGVSPCFCCGVTQISQMNFHCGHCVSEANGGSLEVDNMRPICSGCNGSMGSKNMNDFIKKFKLNGKIIDPVIVQKDFIKITSGNVLFDAT